MTGIDSFALFVRAVRILDLWCLRCAVILTKRMRRAVKMRFPSLSAFRVGHQTFEASHLVPETDRGLQERGHHRPDVLLDQWRGPLCPHPQIQASADVGTSQSRPAALLQLLSPRAHKVFKFSFGTTKISLWRVC